MNKKYDVAILGGGPGGYTLANILATNGKKVALIEKKDLGGTCVNRGCISTKTLIKSAKIYDLLKDTQKYGFDSQINNIDFSAIQNRRQFNKEKLNTNIKNLLTNANVDIYFNSAKVKKDQNNHYLVLDNQTVIEYQKLVLATGSQNRKLSFVDTQNPYVIDSEQALYLNEVPAKLAIIGSGPIALEFAYFYATLGSEVSILCNTEFMQRYDLALKTSVKAYLESKNVKILENVQITQINNNQITYTQTNQENNILADKILVAIGRFANTEAFEELNLENKNGFVIVDENSQTSLDNVYAIGDVTGEFMLTSYAYKSADNCANHILNKNKNQKINTKLIPWSVYLNPEFCGVGLSEEQVKQQNIEYKTFTIPAVALPRYLADGLNPENKFIKFIVDANNDQILGCFMFIEEGNAIINLIALAMKFNISFSDLQQNTYTHPTISEALYYLSRNYIFKK
ncbi:dihydrolipoyl dehydrogenase [Mycoplasma leonicaptivi]|uniref:dihydrolipoyl dehydrogenase n=1 Tax=Mycoplasma leonicaptivi TaxID=36742 RepID=UPI000485D671|nr:dihydrolipoyl dehydrogenase [Mycoplasma leonicaptivi]